MPWFHLIIAGLLEVAWAVGLKQTAGWTRLWPSLITVALMIASFFFLSLALRTLPLGTSYAIWTGIGAVGTAIAQGCRTGDIFNPADPTARRVGTREMGDAVVKALA